MRKGKDQVCKLSVQIYVYTIWNHERSALRFYLKDPPLHGVDNPKQTASENANTLKRVCHALGHKDPVALDQLYICEVPSNSFKHWELPLQGFNIFFFQLQDFDWGEGVIRFLVKPFPSKHPRVANNARRFDDMPVPTFPPSH